MSPQGSRPDRHQRRPQHVRVREEQSAGFVDPTGLFGGGDLTASAGAVTGPSATAGPWELNHKTTLDGSRTAYELKTPLPHVKNKDVYGVGALTRDNVSGNIDGYYAGVGYKFGKDESKTDPIFDAPISVSSSGQAVVIFQDRPQDNQICFTFSVSLHTKVKFIAIGPLPAPTFFLKSPDVKYSIELPRPDVNMDWFFSGGADLVRTLGGLVNVLRN